MDENFVFRNERYIFGRRCIFEAWLAQVETEAAIPFLYFKFFAFSSLQKFFYATARYAGSNPGNFDLEKT